MDTKETIMWLKIMRANLKEFPEISNSKKIEALSNAIRIVGSYKTLYEEHIADVNRFMQRQIDALEAESEEENE